MRSRFWTLPVLTTALIAAPVAAMYVRPDLENVPVDRLISNLERLVTETPTDIPLRLNLARVHAMAFALKSNTVSIQKGRERNGAWTGNEPKYTQLEVKRPQNAEAEKVARQHLARAIATYRDMRGFVQPTFGRAAGYPARLDLVVDLGLGWCLLQAGERDEATVTLRRVAANAWPQNDESGGLHIGHRTVIEEAAIYLLPLLDPVKDQAEIARLKRSVAEASAMPRFITPIAVPLRAGLTALDITDEHATVLFDADGSGIAKGWTWITPDAGWLVYDHRGARQITSALQMFGSVSFWLFWDNGYRALRALDDTGDGRLTGAELNGFAIWRDRNANGQSDPGEVRDVAEWGIVSISSDYEIDATHPDEIAYSPAGVTFADGSSRPTFDLILHTSSARGGSR